MCGRFVQNIEIDDLLEEFEIDENFLDERIDPSFNLAPTQATPVIYFKEIRSLRKMTWGFKSTRPGKAPLINARAESVHTKPSFKTLASRMRCIIPASGFYEWTHESKKIKQPHYMYPSDNSILAFAGLWQKNPRLKSYTFTIITTEANSTLRPIHHRMPVILSKENVSMWMSPDSDENQYMSCLTPAPDSLLTRHPVSTRINSPFNNQPDLLEPALAQADFFNT